MSRVVDLTGQKFGRLAVIERTDNTKQGQAQWKCRCECGIETIVAGADLRKGKTKSCGCLQREIASKSLKTHGHSKDRLYDVWLRIKDRCLNCNSKRYRDYGGRGITICDEWRNDYQAFYEWAMKSGYDAKAVKGECTIDRIDNNKGYSPDNCRWVNVKTQNNNTRKNKIIEYNGEKHSVAQWAEKTGINYHTLYNRIYTYHWTIEKAFNTP